MKMTTEKTIYQAIPEAASEVKVLGKSDKNKFDNYDFVSIDKFLALVNPICSKHGLSAIPSATEMETYQNTSSAGKVSTWARFTYEITLYHASGESIKAQQFVCVPLNGAQASGSAQSYALKQFYRALFNIPTGDKDDADLIATEPHTTPITPRTASWADTVIQDLPPNATPKDKATEIAKAICAQWTRKKSVGELDNEWDRRLALIENLKAKFPELHETVVDGFENRKNEFTEKDAA